MRASRLLSILILLQLRGRLTARSLADEFEVSERTIYRDIDALSMAGVPVYADRGPGGGFALLDGYRTQLTGLAPDEAEALSLIGLAGPAAELGLGAAAGGARHKLLAALPEARARTATGVAQAIHFDPVDWYRAAEPLPQLPAIARAVLDRRVVTMRYASWKAERDWRVEPLGLVLKAGVWYLVARGGGKAGKGKARIFRLSQVHSAEVLDDTFERPVGFDLAAWWMAEQARFEGELFSTTATLRATPLGLQRLAALSPRGAAAMRGAEPAGEGWSKLTMAVEDSDHGARELLGLGAEIEVLAPQSLRQRIADLSRTLARLHQGEPR